MQALFRKLCKLFSDQSSQYLSLLKSNKLFLSLQLLFVRKNKNHGFWAYKNPIKSMLGIKLGGLREKQTYQVV